MRPSLLVRPSLLAVVLAASLAANAVASAEPAPPRALAGVGVDEHLGQHIPLDLWFSDTTGHRIQLGALFGAKPVLLVLSYVRCKMLCSLVLRGVTDAVRDMPLALGHDYRVITVSIDPQEDAATAAARRRTLLDRAGQGEGSDGWSYLVGAERPIRALADSLGFRYTYDARTEQFAHPAVIFLLTPDGRISRYVHGVQFAPAELAGALRVAAAGQISLTSIAEQVLSCFHFDPAARAHREQIETYLRIGGAAIALALGSSVAFLFLWERRRRRRSS